MEKESIFQRNFDNEFQFSSSRSGGPGGQNVNKVNTRVELRFNIRDSKLLSADEKQVLSEKLKNRINNHGELVLISQSERTQYRNRLMVTEKFYIILSKALTVTLPRKYTKPTVISRIKRVDAKKKRGAVKKLRSRTTDPDGSL